MGLYKFENGDRIIVLETEEVVHFKKNMDHEFDQWRNSTTLIAVGANKEAKEDAEIAIANLACLER